VTNFQIDRNFWNKKQVFLTGHTGFKGGWLSLWLSSMGAKVTGYGLPPNTNPSLFKVADVERIIDKSYLADIRDCDKLKESILAARPEIVIHMAAQPLVRYSYANPVETYATNVMGTVNVLECIRKTSSVHAALIVTTDKCYENKEWHWGYRENEQMGGSDPYSSSKGCAELITSAYRRSYFPSEKYGQHKLAIATVRAGNVIGGGDWSQDRLIPDAIKAFESNKNLMVRNPLAVRPWQHVLEPLSGYLSLTQALYQNDALYSGAWNFGPFTEDEKSVEDVINLLIKKWPVKALWSREEGEQPHESHLLKLDCSKAHHLLKWKPKWNLEISIDNIVEWHTEYQKKSNMTEVTMRQINKYLKK